MGSDLHFLCGLYLLRSSFKGFLRNLFNNKYSECLLNSLALSRQRTLDQMCGPSRSLPTCPSRTMPNLPVKSSPSATGSVSSWTTLNFELTMMFSIQLIRLQLLVTTPMVSSLPRWTLRQALMEPSHRVSTWLSLSTRMVSFACSLRSLVSNASVSHRRPSNQLLMNS